MESTRNDHQIILLMAGFAAFPGAPLNPTESLVRSFGANPSGVRIERLVLPVEWGRSWQVLLDGIEAVRPHAVLLFGLHASADRFRIEMTAFNERALERPDAMGRCAETPIIASSPHRIDARLPTEALARSFEEGGLDFEFSQDAGRYLCNETLFHLCANGDALGLRYYGFVHTPLTDECAEEMRRRGIAPRSDGHKTVPASALSLLARHIIHCIATEIGRDAARLAETA